MSNKATSVYAQALQRQQDEHSDKPNRKQSLNITHVRDNSREKARGKAMDNSREKSLNLPTRDDIQVFSFHLRDELKVKVQAEVPHHWQKELDEISRNLDVKKLELYRFIFGEFLGKVHRSKKSLEGDGKGR